MLFKHYYYHYVVVGVVWAREETPAVHVSILSNLNHVGDNITVQCRIVAVPDLHPRVKWVKSAVGDAVEQTIADGGDVVEPYLRLGRYFPSLTPLSHVTLYTVTIYCESPASQLLPQA